MKYVRYFMPAIFCYLMALFILVSPAFAITSAVTTLCVVGTIYAISVACIIQEQFERSRALTPTLDSRFSLENQLGHDQRLGYGEQLGHNHQRGYENQVSAANRQLHENLKLRLQTGSRK